MAKKTGPKVDVDKLEDDTLYGRYYRLKGRTIKKLTAFLKENSSLKKEGVIDDAINEYIERRK